MNMLADAYDVSNGGKAQGKPTFQGPSGDRSRQPVSLSTKVILSYSMLRQKFLKRIQQASKDLASQCESSICSKESMRRSLDTKHLDSYVIQSCVISSEVCRP